jgi:LmbE family N-acetylglucosaminyl deacetylase
MQKVILALFSCLLLIPAYPQDVAKNADKRNILIIMAHPDDWEGAMGGTAYLLKDKYQIHVAIASKGERGIKDKSPEESGRIREQEAITASKCINAQLHFLGQMDSEIYADKASVDKVVALLKELDPVMVFTRWGIDSADHEAVADMALKALAVAGMLRDREIYLTEAQRGGQTNQFNPDLFVNVSRVYDKKRELIRCHVSQNRDDIILKIHESQDRMSGRIAHCDYAEAFKVYSPLIGARDGRKVSYTLLDLE